MDHLINRTVFFVIRDFFSVLIPSFLWDVTDRLEAAHHTLEKKRKEEEERRNNGRKEEKEEKRKERKKRTKTR